MCMHVCIHVHCMCENSCVSSCATGGEEPCATTRPLPSNVGLGANIMIWLVRVHLRALIFEMMQGCNVYGGQDHFCMKTTTIRAGQTLLVRLVSVPTMECAPAARTRNYVSARAHFCTFLHLGGRTQILLARGFPEIEGHPRRWLPGTVRGTSPECVEESHPVSRSQDS
jgi:hypothetical protein